MFIMVFPAPSSFQTVTWATCMCSVKPGLRTVLWRNLQHTHIHTHSVVGWMVASKKMGPCPNSCKLFVALFGKRVFADVIKVRVLRWDHPGLPEWALNPRTSAISREERQRETWDRRGGGRDWSDRATNQDCLNPQEAERGREQNLPQGLSRKCSPAHSLILYFRHPELWAYKFLLF